VTPMTTRSDTHGASEPRPRARRAATSQVLDGTATTAAPAAPVAASVAAPGRTRGRLFFVDNLRVYLTILVLAHHLAITYGNIPAWTYLEPPSNPAEGAPLDLLVGLNQVYFMGFFFLLSGYFTPRSFDTKGARRFSLDRLRRLGIPLLAFLFLLRPLYTLPAYFAIAPDERPSYALYYVLSFDPGPLWFVEVLLVFALGYALIRTWRPAPAKVVDEQARPPRFWASRSVRSPSSGGCWCRSGPTSRSSGCRAPRTCRSTSACSPSGCSPTGGTGSTGCPAPSVGSVAP
jgi:hypothetical protein